METTTSLELAGPSKAAIVMVMLGDRASAEVLKLLNEDEVHALSSAIARLGEITPETTERVAREFVQIAANKAAVTRGGPEYARKMLHAAFGPETGKKLSEKLPGSTNDSLKKFESLRKADPQQLARFLSGEHPQTIAVILAHLQTSQACELLRCLPPEARADAAARVATLDRLSTEVVDQVAARVVKKLSLLGETRREASGGPKMLAELFNGLPTDVTEELLAGVEAQDSHLADQVRSLMFLFEDLIKIDINGIKELMGRADRKTLMVALKGTSEQLQAHLLQTMSQRGADMLREDMEALGPVKIKEVEAAQKQMITMARQLEREGVLSLRASGGEQQYVV